MVRKGSILTSRYVSAALVWAGLAGLFIAPAGAFPTGPGPSGPRVLNSTRSFKIVAVERSDNGDYRLSLKNENEKAITAFRVFLPFSNRSIREDSRATGEPIAPGAIEVLRIPSESLASAGVDQYSDRANVLINAVVFDDKTGEGRADVLAEMSAERFGEKRELTRAVTRLRRLLEAGDTQLITSLDSLRAEHRAAPGEGEEASLLADFKSESPSIAGSPDVISRGIGSGLKSGLEKARHMLADLEVYGSIDDGTPAPVIVFKVREASEKIISELERIIEKL
ncbi:MAG TPA: hypothetical protein VKC34_14190 [Blastocatellia bacterium]|nr:hypothetical protein [Blastocatellia bacterium]